MCTEKQLAMIETQMVESYGGVWMETGNASSFIKMLAKNRNTVFLYLCLIVHLSYFWFFLF